MPLYDGDMVNLLTPDGRAVSMPGGLAALFPGLQPAAPIPVPDVTSGATASDQAGSPPHALPPIAAAAPPVTAPLPAEGPVTDPSQLPAPTGATMAPRGPVTSPDEPKGPPQQRAPEPPATNQQLAKNWEGRALQESDRAADEERAGVMASARIQAEEATREGNRMAQRDAETERILQEKAKQAAANEAELNARISARDALAEQIAKTRIDRSVDHPIWSQIGLILSTIGTAMTRRPGEAWSDPAYNTLMQQIDRKVQGQMQDLDAKRASLAQMNVGVTEQRQHNVDRLTEIDARRDAAIQQAQQAVQTIGMQMKAPAAIAGAQQLLGKLDQERAKLHAEYGKAAQDQMNVEAARAQTAQLHRESLGVTVRGQDMEQARFEKQLAATEREKMAANAVALLKEKGAEAAAKVKRIEEGGLFDPRTQGRDPLLNAAGEAKVKQADRVEAQTRENPYAGGMAYIEYLKSKATTDDERKNIAQIEARVRTDPQLATRAGKEYADTLRADARINDAAVVSPKAAEKLREHIGTAQEATDQIGDLEKLLESEPSAFNREQWAGAATKLANLALIYQKVVGERPSVKAFEQTMQHVLEFDPDSYWHREVNQKRALESLKKLKGIVASDIKNELGAQGAGTSWVPIAKGEGDRDSKFALEDKTAAERGEGQSLGFINRFAAGVLNADSVEQQMKDEAHADAAMAPGAEGGLTSNAATHIKALAVKATAAGDEEHDQIVQSLAGSVSSGLKAGGRSGIAPGILEVLRNASPAVYQDVIAALPESDRKAVTARDALIRKATNVPNKPSGFDPDAAAESDAAERYNAAVKRFNAPQRSPGAGTPR